MEVVLISVSSVIVFVRCAQGLCDEGGHQGAEVRWWRMVTQDCEGGGSSLKGDLLDPPALAIFL